MRTSLLLALLARLAFAQDLERFPCPAAPPPWCGNTIKMKLQTAYKPTRGPGHEANRAAFQFKWKGTGPGFGNPTTGLTMMTLCMWDATGLRWQGPMRPQRCIYDINLGGGMFQHEDEPCWFASGNSQKYIHKSSATVGIIDTFVTDTGVYQTVLARGQGVYLAFGHFFEPVWGINFPNSPYTLPVRFALLGEEQGDPGSLRCWGDTITEVRENVTDKFLGYH